jgi:adenosylcobyric acid synthase
MHMGETAGSDTARPFALLEDGRAEGATNPAGNVTGTYLHGLFASTELRGALLARIGVAGNGRDHAADVDAALEAIAAELAAHIDIDALLRIAARTA